MNPVDVFDKSVKNLIDTFSSFIISDSPRRTDCTVQWFWLEEVKRSYVEIEFDFQRRCSNFANITKFFVVIGQLEAAIELNFIRTCVLRKVMWY